MQNKKLREILTLCFTLEKAAAEIYLQISELAAIDAHKAFWQDISSDEKRHVGYWEKLLDLEEEGALRNPFDDPVETQAKLNLMKLMVDEMLAHQDEVYDVSRALLLAFRLESLMLNPSFSILLRVMKNAFADESPEDDYREHIDKFSQFVGIFLNDSEEMKLLAEVLTNMWEYGREVANQFDHIKTLRGLIPICSSCKKVRQEEEVWEQIELYLAKHSDAEFTHCLCPDCALTLYPEIFGKKK